MALNSKVFKLPVAILTKFGYRLNDTIGYGPNYVAGTKIVSGDSTIPSNFGVTDK